MKLISNFSARLSILIKETELTYEELGARIGENPSTLNRYALGQRIPKAEGRGFNYLSVHHTKPPNHNG